MPTTDINGLRFPALSNASNVPLDLANLAADLDTRLNSRHATTTARDAAITSPTNGMIAWTDDAGQWQRIAGAWRLINPITKPHFQGYRTSAQSIPHDSETTVTWNGELYDASGAHTPTGTVFTAPYSAFYRCQASVGFAANADGYRHIFMRLDGTNVDGTAATVVPQQSVVPQMVTTPSRRIWMTAGQQLDVRVKQTSGGGALNTTSGSGATSGVFEVVWDGAA